MAKIKHTVSFAGALYTVLEYVFEDFKIGMESAPDDETAVYMSNIVENAHAVQKHVNENYDKFDYQIPIGGDND